MLAVVTLDSIGKVVTFIVMLGILIVLHELGHFIVARRNGVRVNEFAVGFGPKLFGWTSPRTGTLYALRLVLIGGYCAMQGEDGKTSEAEQQREFRALPGGAVHQDNFQAKSPWRRLAIVVAGPIANFVLCFVILLVGALVFGVMGDTPSTRIGEVLPGYPASAHGIKVGDRIVQINGTPIRDGNQIVSTTHDSLGKSIAIVFESSGERHVASMTPVPCQPHSKLGCIGILPISTLTHVSPIAAVQYSGNEFAAIADETVSSIGLLVTHFTKYAGQISGPIGMGQAAQTIQDFGWGPYLTFAATISFALGLFNLLPIPALDGGRAAFIVVELVRRKPVDPEKEAFVHIAAFAAMLALMLIVAAHDIARIISGQGVL